MTDDALIEQLRALDGRLTDIHGELQKEGIKRDERIHTNRVLNVWAIAAAIIGIIAGGAAGFYGQSVHNDQRAAAHRTAAARIASCEQDNGHAIDQRDADKAEIRRVTDALVESAADPGLAQLRAETFLRGHKADHSDGYDALVDKEHPYRDCTPSGIAKYLNIASANIP